MSHHHPPLKHGWSWEVGDPQNWKNSLGQQDSRHVDQIWLSLNPPVRNVSECVLAFNPKKVEDKWGSFSAIGVRNCPGTLIAFSKAVRNVLLVEDDPILCTVFKSILFDYDPRSKMDWVTDAHAAFSKIEEASRKASRMPYDLVVVDVFLEGDITGVDIWNLCQRVYPSMPVLVMSVLPAYKLYAYVGQGHHYPNFLQKPIDPTECRNLLGKVFSPARA